jgi:glycosyltransferase involved in cell wall biosynthesis
MRRIAFVVQLPRNVSPGQRFRFEQYESLLTSHGFAIDTFSFLDEQAYSILYKKGFLLRKITAVLKGFLKRIQLLGKIGRYDYIFLQREFAPVGPPIFEWIVIKLLGRKLIYDFDDAIWIPNVSEGNRLAGYIKCYWKVGLISKWSYKVSVGNMFLGAYAKRFTDKVYYNPTCVDTEKRYQPIQRQKDGLVTIGWTGSHSTLQFLEVLYPVLQKLEQVHPFRFLVICNKRPDFTLKSMEFIPWKRETEIEDLARIDIGIMPLKEDAWSEGKCGFKIIQYMALGIPAVASPVGVNKEIIDHGQNGYICATEEEWIRCLSELLSNEMKRQEFGRSGRTKIQQSYSVASNAGNIIALFSN